MERVGQFDSPVKVEAGEQLAYIESMIREGRKTTEYWGWSLVLWGVSYLVATAWSSVPAAGRSAAWAWPVTMILATILTCTIGYYRGRGKPTTMRSRALESLWQAVGFGILLFSFTTLYAHRYGDGHTYIAAIEILLGVAQIGSGLILRWLPEVIFGALWWVAAVITTITRSDLGVSAPFLTATFVCMIGFGVYLMVREARDKAAQRAGQVLHA